MRIPAYFWALSLTPLAALGNVEKVIFLAPPSISIPSSHSNLQDLYLDVLSTPLSLLSLRRQLPASFPSPTDPRGNETWLLLEGLEVGRRYEVRICWLATQPTSFLLDTFQLSEVSESPSLISSLAAYLEKRQDSTFRSNQDIMQSGRSAELFPASGGAPISTLLLRVSAAADYFTTNTTLMQNVPLVEVEIILDPFFFNVFPTSLVPTAVYIVVIAIGAWYLSSFIWLGIHCFSQMTETPNSTTPFSEPSKKDL